MNRNATRFEAVLVDALLQAIRPVIHNAVNGKMRIPALPDVKQQIAQNAQREITLPREGGKCRAVWDALDEMTKTGEPTVSQIMQYAEEQGWSSGNARSEFYRWKHYRSDHPVTRRGGRGVGVGKAPSPRATHH